MIRGAILFLALLLAGCGPAVPSSTAVGEVTVSVVRNDNLFLGSAQHARLIAPDGGVIGTWELDLDRPPTATAVEGDYTLEAFTVFVSDFAACEAPGSCAPPTLEPAFTCTMPVRVRAATPVRATLTIELDRCRVDPGSPAGSDAPPRPADAPG
jgi:hypothetical protein